MLEELHKVAYIIDGKLVNLENNKEDLFDLMHQCFLSLVFLEVN